MSSRYPRCGHVGMQAVDSIEQAARETLPYELSLETLVALSELTPNEREVIVDHFWRGDTLGTIAEAMGITKSRVSQLKARALVRLRTGGRFDR